MPPRPWRNRAVDKQPSREKQRETVRRKRRTMGVHREAVAARSYLGALLYRIENRNPLDLAKSRKPFWRIP
jgi:hypothetical protein